MKHLPFVVYDNKGEEVARFESKRLAEKFAHTLTSAAGTVAWKIIKDEHPIITYFTTEDITNTVENMGILEDEDQPDYDPNFKFTEEEIEKISSDFEVDLCSEAWYDIMERCINEALDKRKRG